MQLFVSGWPSNYGDYEFVARRTTSQGSPINLGDSAGGIGISHFFSSIPVLNKGERKWLIFHVTTVVRATSPTGRLQGGPTTLHSEPSRIPPQGNLQYHPGRQLGPPVPSCLSPTTAFNR